MSDFDDRTLVGLARAVLVLVGRTDPADLAAIVRDSPERAALVLHLCAAIAAHIPRDAWLRVWTRPLAGSPFHDRSLADIVQSDDQQLRDAVARAVAVLMDHAVP